MTGSKHVSAPLLVLLLTLFSPLAFAANDCDCEAISCGACETEIDLKFYTVKCDGGNRVKSCKRPICAAVENPTGNCRSPASVNAAPPTEELKEEKKEVEVALESVKNSIGIVVVSQGTSMIQRQGKTFTGKVGFKIYEKDYLETGSDGKLKIKFKDDNVINLAPNSKLTIEELNFDLAKGNKKTLLNLLYGKVRSSVKHDYNQSGNYYEVKTPSAVAGVRGTEFVTSFSSEDKMETKVETLKGRVVLSDPKKSKKIEVPASSYASFVVDKVEAGVFSDKDISSFVARGYLTPVFKMTSEELKKLEINTNFTQEEDERNLASTPTENGKEICSDPQGDFNQCAWTCEGNTFNEKKCRTDLPNVHCVRKRCNANGKWAEETRLPAAFHENCEANKPVIKDCDY